MFDIKEHDTTAPAPGALEVLQRFLNLHEHRPGVEADLPPSPELVRAYLVERGLLAPDAPYSRDDHERAMALFNAIHGYLRAGATGSPAEAEIRTIDETASRAGLRLRFGTPRLEPAASGVDGALGRLVVLLFLAELDGTWSLMKECASDTCSAVFYDRSKNHSGKWCSMQSCGNRHKVRAWRQRHRLDAVDA